MGYIMSEDEKIELSAEVRNKLQPSVTVLTRLSEGKEVPKHLLTLAKKDLEELVKTLENL